MSDYENIFKIVGGTAVAFLLFGLLGWYLFLSRNTSELESIGESRGFSVGIPSFAGTRGSTIENLAQGLALQSGNATDSTNTSDTRAPRLWVVNQTPVAGAGFITNGSTTLIRFVERSTGHVFDANPETSEVVRRTNTSLGPVYQAYVGSGETVILQTLGDDGIARTLLGTFGTTTEEGLQDLDTIELGSAMEAGFSGEDAVLLTKSETGSAVVKAGESEGILFSSPLSHWHMARIDTLVLTERSASNIVGSAFHVTPQGTLTKITSAPGLTLAVHPTTDAYLIGSDTGRALALSVQPGRDATSVALDIQTTAEKCVWAPGTSLTAYCGVPQEPPATPFLDLWYRGKTHTDDSWFVIESSTGSAEPLFTPPSDTDLDVENPMVDESARYILFTNARDKSLWLLRIIE